METPEVRKERAEVINLLWHAKDKPRGSAVAARVHALTGMNDYVYGIDDGAEPILLDPNYEAPELDPNEIY